MSDLNFGLMNDIEKWLTAGVGSEEAKRASRKERQRLAAGTTTTWKIAMRLRRRVSLNAMEGFRRHYWKCRERLAPLQAALRAAELTKKEGRFFADTEREIIAAQIQRLTYGQEFSFPSER